ncbi:MAG TPA: VCBS repeat-containing protein [Tepidisphaeraceae bacterium]|nr:VCBS repeat-containing protein [Tepidisphaeraceae bacterium]
MRKTLFLSALFAVVIGMPGLSARAQEWIEDSYEDFADGKLDASGHNLYVSRDGSVRTIHRFDFNNDGHIDLLFNSTHDVGAYVPATLGTLGDGRSLRSAPLAVQGSQRIVAGDLNNDGQRDLVFLRSRSGIQGARSLLTILWGAPGGAWPASRAAGALPEPHYPSDAALPDLDANGWSDVVIFGQGRKPRSFVYWGGEQGMGTFRRGEFAAPAGTRAAAADFDGDGFADLACASVGKLTTLWAAKGQRELESRKNSELAHAELPTPQSIVTAQIVGAEKLDLAIAAGSAIFIIAGDGKREWSKPVKVDVPATHVAAGDLDGDGATDLVLTNFAQTFAAGGEAGGAKTADRSVVILWGDGKRFAADRSTVLSSPNATASAIGDFDGDGRADLAVAIYQGETHFEGKSLLFFGAGDRTFTRADGGFDTQAPTDVLALPASDGKPARAVFANSQRGTLNEKVPLDLYWGSTDGFDPSNRWQIPFASGSEHSAADLNADGFADLLLTYSGHGGQRAETDARVGTHILWGAKSGFALDRRTVLKEDLIWSTNVADLNRDGYLDIIACQESKGPHKAAHVYLYYGGADGFNDERRVAIPVGSRALAGHAADLNGDGWLDVITSDWFDSKVTILWGGTSGFAAERAQVLEVDRPIAVEVADINGDDKLDLLVGVYSDNAQEEYDLGSFVYWGNAAGFTHANAQWIPGLTVDDLTVADFDADGHLDVFSSNYHAIGMRESLPGYLFWGGDDGLDPDRKMHLTVDSASGALAADFDRDGKLDLAVSCHARHGSHHTMSKVFYNDGKRYAHPRITELPTAGSHWMDMHDMGHVRDRSWRQTYESSAFTWDRSATRAVLAAEADVPPGSTLKLEVRSAPSADALNTGRWRPVDDESIKLAPADRAMQYRAVFHSDNGDRFPTLKRIRIKL